MTPYTRIIPLVLAVSLTACINVPEVDGPETPDAGLPDAGPKPDAGTPADTTPPTITATMPLHGSTNVATSTQMVLTFSEPMNVSTVQVNITPIVALSGSTWSNGNTQLTLQPTAPLAQNTIFSLVVDGKDVAGNRLTERTVFSFTTTGPAPDTTAPTVLTVSPNYGAIGVARNASITVTFSEPMDKASAQTAFAITAPSGFDSGAFSWNAAGTEMSFNPDNDFPYGTDVAWSVSTAAKDLAANALGGTSTGTFRTIRQSITTIDFDPYTSGSAAAPTYWRNHLAYTFEFVGDDNNNIQYRLLLGFKLDALPEDLVRITDSKLKWYITGMHGEPFNSLGSFLLERVYIGESIAFSDAESTNPDAKVQYESPTLNPPIIIPSNVNTVQIVDVTSLVTLDWAERVSRNTKRSQFRLRFETPSDSDSRNDNLYSDVDQGTKLPQLQISYEHP